MKSPAWFTAELAILGRQVVGSQVTRDAAAARLTEMALKQENRPFLRHIIHTWMLGKVRGWVDGYLGSMTAEQIAAATGALPLPCLDLPALLEVSPGRFVHQNSVTREDLKAAVVQAQTKQANATGYADRVRRLASAALPLMADETVTLGSIASKLPALLRSGVLT